jgi:hypothetical protein
VREHSGEDDVVYVVIWGCGAGYFFGVALAFSSVPTSLIGTGILAAALFSIWSRRVRHLEHELRIRVGGET